MSGPKGLGDSCKQPVTQAGVMWFSIPAPLDWGDSTLHSLIQTTATVPSIQLTSLSWIYVWSSAITANTLFSLLSVVLSVLVRQKAEHSITLSCVREYGKTAVS